jgi:hypothetical protein
MKTGQKTNFGKLTLIEEYFNRLHEAGKKGPGDWIIVSSRMAEELKKITKNNKNGRKRSKSW